MGRGKGKGKRGGRGGGGGRRFFVANIEEMQLRDEQFAAAEKSR